MIADHVRVTTCGVRVLTRLVTTGDQGSGRMSAVRRSATMTGMSPDGDERLVLVVSFSGTPQD